MFNEKLHASNIVCKGKNAQIGAPLPGLTAMVKHDDHDMTWYDHGDIYSPWYDHGKIMAWPSRNIA